MRNKLVYLLLALGLVTAGFCYGFLAHERELFPYRLGASVSRLLTRLSERFDHTNLPPIEKTAEQKRRERLAQLDQLGYLSGYEPPPPEVGVLTYDKQLASKGDNFYVTTGGPTARLMDMEGVELHTWTKPFDKDWPLLSPRDELIDYDRHPNHWRRARLLPGGDVLALMEGTGLVKVDKDSNLLWAYQGGFHHDLDVTDDGRIFVLTRRRIPEHPLFPYRAPVIEDFISVLSAEGKLIRRVSLLDAVANSPYREFLVEHVPPGQDLLHPNTVTVLRGRLESRSPAFRRGNVLVSFRNINVIAVVDLGRPAIVWALAGLWQRQHDPVVLDNGNLLLFDNFADGEHSRVLEFDPFTQQIVWQFDGNETHRFFAYYAGTNQRLPNGNTLFTSSTEGRVMEVTPDKRIAWEWANPRRTDDQNHFIAVVNDLVRVDHDFVDGWLASE